MSGYAWDNKPLLELVSTSCLLTTLLWWLVITTFKLLKPSNNVLSRFLVLFVLVLITLLAISRQFMDTYVEMLILLIFLIVQATRDWVAAAPPSALQVERGAQRGHPSHPLQQVC